MPVFWNSHVLINFLPAINCVPSGMVTSRTSTAASLQSESAVIADMGADSVSGATSRIGSDVAHTTPAFVGAKVAVTKSGRAETCGSKSTEMQDASKTSERRHITFLYKEVIIVFIFDDNDWTLLMTIKPFVLYQMSVWDEALLFRQIRPREGVIRLPLQLPSAWKFNRWIVENNSQFS